MSSVLNSLSSAVVWQGQDVKENVSVANNACWAIGEVAVKVESCSFMLSD